MTGKGKLLLDDGGWVPKKLTPWYPSPSSFSKLT